MKLHANARTCPHSRRLAVDRVEWEGWTLAAAAEAAGVSVRTVSKWLRRYRDEGEQGLLDRCSAPGSVPLRTGESRVAVIAALRRLRMTGAEIAETLAMPASTVSGILTRIGFGKLWRLEPLEPAHRYEKQRPGELVYVDVLDDERAATAVGFLRRAVAHFASFGIHIERLMTDNGSAYRATIHALACKALGIKHLRTRPYRPRTNGKASASSARCSAAGP